MRRYSLILFILLYASFFYAQKGIQGFVYPVYAVGISPSAFISVYPAVQVSQDFGIYKPFNISLESGYIYSTSYSDRDAYGFRLRPSVECYFGNVLSLRYSIGVFYSYRFTRDNYDFEIDHRDYSYIETGHIEKEKVLKGYGVQLGIRNDIDNRFYFEFNLGLGIGELIVESNADNFGIIESPSSLFVSNYRDGVYPRTILYFNINVSYRIF